MNSKKYGYTVVELMVGVAILGVLVAVAVGFFASVTSEGSAASVGINGVVETRCVNGYAFIVGNDGAARQIMDEFGHGVRCSGQ